MLKDLLKQLPDTYTQLVLDLEAKRVRRAAERSGKTAPGRPGAGPRPAGPDAATSVR